MDAKFPLMLICASATAFAGTWMYLSGQFPGHHPIEMHAHGHPETTLTFSNCQQVEAAGLAPIYAGQAGYRKDLDPDGTGMACPPRH